MEQPDMELARAWAGRGDREAFHGLYTRYAQSVFAFARHMCGSADAAEEVVQETFLRAGRAMASFRNQATFRSWLLAIARNTVHDLGRRQVRRQRDETRPAPANPGPNPGEVADAEEIRTAVRAAVLDLPEDQRLAITLCSLQELPLREAAATLGWRVEKLKTVLYRARQKLKEALGGYMET